MPRRCTLYACSTDNGVRPSEAAGTARMQAAGLPRETGPLTGVRMPMKTVFRAGCMLASTTSSPTQHYPSRTVQLMNT
jgi:hypothetical protein